MVNYNLIGYGAFIALIVLIIVLVGRTCYRNGNLFVAELLPGHLELCRQINKVLLIGYYLVNIGYCAITLVSWQQITSIGQLVEVIAVKMAIIIGVISVLHYLNIFLLTTQVQKLIR